MSDRVGEALVLLLILLLPLSALVARRMPGATMFRYAVAWAMVFVVLFASVRIFT